jgi:hypothetical protein
LHRLRIVCLSLFLPLLAGAATAQEQEQPKLEVAVSFIAQRSLKANTDQNFWMQGGSIQLGTNSWKGWGIAADVTAAHGSSIGKSGVPLSLETTTFGPRYRWHANRRWSPYGEVLFGEANAFRTLVPTRFGAQTDANSMALEIGGALDYRLKRHLALRVLDAAWLRTQIPNSTNNVQNILRLGAGVVVRFGH